MRDTLNGVSRSSIRRGEFYCFAVIFAARVFRRIEYHF